MNKFRRNLMCGLGDLSDEYILNVSSVLAEGSMKSDGLYFKIQTLAEPLIATFKGQIKTIPANTEFGDILFSTNGIETGDLTFKGSYSYIYPEYIYYAAQLSKIGAKINSIKKWYKNINKTLEYQFQYQNINFDVKLPYKVKNIIGGPFYKAKFSGSNLNGKFILHKDLKTIGSLGVAHNYILENFFSNAELINDIWFIDNIALEVKYPYNNADKTSYLFPNGTKKIAKYLFTLFGGSDTILDNAFTYITNITFNNDGLLEYIPEGLCYGTSGLLSIIIPRSVKSIGELAFADKSGAMNMTEITFNHQQNDELYLPPFQYPIQNPTGIFRVKTARTMNVYTEHQTVLDYNFYSDNISPTIYHLDRTTQFDKLDAPILSINGSILTITPSLNSERYILYRFGDELKQFLTTNNLIVDLSEYIDIDNKIYTIKARASADGYASSDFSNSVNYPYVNPVSITIGGSSYNSSRNFTIEQAEAQDGVAIYYTVETSETEYPSGSTPTSSSTLYNPNQTNVFSVSTGNKTYFTVKAIGIKTGYASSEIATSQFILNDTFPL